MQRISQYNAQEKSILRCLNNSTQAGRNAKYLEGHSDGRTLKRIQKRYDPENRVYCWF